MLISFLPTLGLGRLAQLNSSQFSKRPRHATAARSVESFRRPFRVAGRQCIAEQ